MAQDRERSQRDQRAHCHNDEGRQCDVEQRITRQFDPALEAYGKQQKDAQGLVEDPGNLEVRANEASDRAQQEEPDDGFEVGNRWS